MSNNEMGRSGEIHLSDKKVRNFAKVISLYDLMIELNLTKIRESLDGAEKEFSAIQKNKTYSESESFFYWNVFVSLTNVLFHDSNARSDRRQGLPYLPETFNRAQEIFDAQPWASHRSGTRKVGYKPPSQKIPDHLKPKKTKGATFLYEWENLKRAFDTDLKNIKVLQLEKDESALYANLTPFGLMVAKRFPQIKGDVIEAAQCLALARYPATVFHLMRATEVIVHLLAKKLGVELYEIPPKGQPPTKHKEWHNLVDQIGAATKALPKRTAAEKEKGKRYGYAADHLMNVKEERNNVCHARNAITSSYTKAKAAYVYDEVERFMLAMVAVAELP